MRIRHAEAIARAGLIALLAGHPHVCLAEEVREPAAGVVVVVTDYADAMARLPQAPQRGERIMIVSQRECEWDVRAAMAAGVHGYLTQRCEAAELQAALLALGKGQRYFNKELLARALHQLAGCQPTLRESEVLELLARGYSNKRIALALEISVTTVKCHVRSLFGKLGATARTHAVVLASQQGLIPQWAAPHP